MDSVAFSPISLADQQGIGELDELLAGAGIRRDGSLDYIAGMYNSSRRLVAAGACSANTLRCLAVDDARQGEGLMAQMVSHLVEYQMAKGVAHLFLYTRCDKAPLFSSLGFHEIARVENQVAFMENRRDGFTDYLREIGAGRKGGRGAALVMNCNPFTLGHRYLAERAAAENDVLHLFVVSEDASLIPFADRYRMVEEGCGGLGNVALHRTDSYMISSAVFPAYFMEDRSEAIEAQAKLDLLLFSRIAAALGVARRYVGEEPFSRVTGLYNQIMAERLPSLGIACVIIPRMEAGGQAVSASRVRRLIHDGPIEAIKELVPPSTYGYFLSEAGKRSIQRIREAQNVTHY